MVMLIFKKILKLFLRLFRNIKNAFDALYNFTMIKYHGVSYQTYPVIAGRLLLRNAGKIVLGDKVVFNNNTLYNGIGIYKSCSVVVKQNAVFSVGDCSGFSGVSIYCANKIVIGNNVKLGGNVSIWDTDFHPLDYLKRRNDENHLAVTKPIEIMDDVFIGANSIILKGVTIGRKSIIAAGSIVTNNVPDCEVWGGNPAKLIRKIDAK